MSDPYDRFDEPEPQQKPQIGGYDRFDVPVGGDAPQVVDAKEAGRMRREQEAERRGLKAVGTYDNGTIYKAPDGSMQFVSPGYSTSDPEAIENMMQGMRPHRPTMGTGEGMARAAYQGGTFGKGDEIVAGIGATADSITGEPGGWQERYDAYLARERSDIDQFREEQPFVAGASEFAGAIPTALALGGGATSGPMLLRMTKGGLTGAAAGLDYGFSSGEGGMTQRLEDGAGDAVLGGFIGGVAAPAGAAFGRAREAYLTSKAARQASSTPAAYREVARVIGADDALGNRATARLTDADSMLADVGSASSSQLDTAIQKSGPAGSIARRAVDERVARSGQRITQAMDDTLGRPGESSSRALVPYGDKSNPVSGLYERAYKQPIDYSGEAGRRILDNVQNRVPPEAITAAKKLMRTEGNMSRQMFAEIAEDGSVTFTRLPDVRELDYLTRGLQQVAREADGQGAMGGQTPVGRAYGNLATEMRDTLKELVPEWKQAVDQARKLIGAKKARDLGRNDLFKPSMYREDLAPIIAKMSPEEKRKVAEGLRIRIDETLSNVKRTAGSPDIERQEAIRALKELSSRGAKDKMEMVVGKDAADRMAREIDNASRAFELESQVAAGSRTFARQQTQGAIDAQVTDGVVNAFRSGEPLNVGKRMVQSLLGRTAADKERISDETMSEIVKLLLRQGPAAQQTARDLLNQSQMVQPGADRAGRFAEILMRKAAAASAPLKDQLLR